MWRHHVVSWIFRVKTIFSYIIAFVFCLYDFILAYKFLKMTFFKFKMHYMNLAGSFFFQSNFHISISGTHQNNIQKKKIFAHSCFSLVFLVDKKYSPHFKKCSSLHEARIHTDRQHSPVHINFHCWDNKTFIIKFISKFVYFFPSLVRFFQLLFVDSGWFMLI